jgi:xanthine dehydrogenase accessory factor
VAGLIIVRGGGDLSSGAILRLARAGMGVVVLELARPLAVRRLVAFAEAVIAGEITIEDVAAQRVETPQAALEAVRAGKVPVLVDPGFESCAVLQPLVIVDGRMTKRPPELEKDPAGLVVGLGPGFIAGENCHAVIETKRGADLGRVIWHGGAEADTGLPDPVWEYQSERVLRAPEEGLLEAFASIGDRLQAGQVVAAVNGQPVRATFAGVLRGLLRNGTPVWRGLKIGDVDPRNDPRLCSLVSDKALAVGGGVLEAILARPEIRSRLWDPPRGARQRRSKEAKRQ